MQNKKGLSGIVTNLIIVLLALVAVGIVWIVIQNVIVKNSEQVFLGQITIDLKIKSVNVKTSDNQIDINVKRNFGKGILTGLKFIVSGEGNEEIFEELTPLEELESQIFTLNYAGIVKKISIAPIFEGGSIGNIVDTYIVGEYCEPDCGTQECGAAPNGCGTCGTCAASEVCETDTYTCIECTPDCSCASSICIGATCIDPICSSSCDGLLEPDCGTQECGAAPNGCGDEDECGTCGVGYSCDDGICIEETCTPDCSCAASTCIGATCIEPLCLTSCSGTLAPNCGTRVCGAAPNGCGDADECGTCEGICVEGNCIITEPVMLLEDGFENTDWDANWDNNGLTDWSHAVDEYQSGSYSAKNNGNLFNDDLISDNLDASGTSISINIFFWYYKDDLDPGEFYLEIYNGTNYNSWLDLDAYQGDDNCNVQGDDRWCRFNEIITDTQYFKSNFRLKFEGSETDFNENVWIDDVKITQL